MTDVNANGTSGHEPLVFPSPVPGIRPFPGKQTGSGNNMPRYIHRVNKLLNDEGEYGYTKYRSAALVMNTIKNTVPKGK